MDDIYTEPGRYPSIWAFEENPVEETIYNVFLYEGKDGIIREMGIVAHENVSGADKAKIRMLQEAVERDLPDARKFPIPEAAWIIFSDGVKIRGAIRVGTFNQLREMNQHYYILEPMFTALKARRDPLSVITYIADGKPKIEGFVNFGTVAE